MYKVMFLAIVLLMAIPSFTHASDGASCPAGMNGDGQSAETACEITTWQQLASIKDAMSLNYKLTNDLSASTADYSIYASSSANGGQGWLPIIGLCLFFQPGGPPMPFVPTDPCMRYEEFSGVFDGGGFSISDLVINRPSQERVGLFSNLMSTEIFNVKMLNVQVVGGQYTGSLAGITQEGTVPTKISRVFVSGQVEGSAYVGGLVGYLAKSEVSVVGANVTVIAQEEVGGLVGNMYASLILDSYTHGSVFATTSSAKGGGLVGSLINIYGITGLTRTYTTAIVDGVNPIGALVGIDINNDGVYSNNFWNTELSAISPGYGVGSRGTNPSGISEITIEQMKQSSTFINAGWDFRGETTNGTDDIWIMDPESGYPVHAPVVSAPECDIADAIYSGVFFASPTTTKSSEALVQLAATLELNEGADVSTQKIRFVNLDEDEESEAYYLTDWLTAQPLAEMPDFGTVSTQLTVQLGSADSRQIRVGIVEEVCGLVGEETLVTVSKPLNDFVTGGGYVIAAKSVGMYAADQGSKVNFGFNVKFNKKKTNLQGNANIIFRVGDKVYQIKANNFSSLTTTQGSSKNPAQATFTTRANLTDVTNPEIVTTVASQRNLVVTMSDRTAVGSKENATDAISITLWESDGTVLFSSSWNQGKAEQQQLAGGNLQINQGGSNLAGQALADAGEDLNDDLTEELPVNFALHGNYPNPFNPTTNIRFDLPEQASVRIEVVDVLGRQVMTVTPQMMSAGANKTITLDASRLASGTYFYRVIAEGATRSFVQGSRFALVK